MTYFQALEIFVDEFARSGGFGRCDIQTDSWTDEEVQQFIRRCTIEAKQRGAIVKGVLVGVAAARKLGIGPIIGVGAKFGDICCFVTEDEDRIDILFGPA